MQKIIALMCLLYLPTSFVLAESELMKVIKEITPSVVGVGIVTPIEGNRVELQGTGFVIADGGYIVTNYHVVSAEIDLDKVQHRVIFEGKGKRFKVHRVEVLDYDPIFDLAILKIIDPSVKLPSKFKIGESDFKGEGTEIAFTGYPIGAVLGLYPATHRGIIAAITPDATPVESTSQLKAGLINRLKHSFNVYQLDATAFPGNSGSAMYDSQSGEVIGIINKVMVQSGKEYALSSPSGITYAIPVKHLRNLAAKNKIDL